MFAVVVWHKGSPPFAWVQTLNSTDFTEHSDHTMYAVSMHKSDLRLRSNEQVESILPYALTNTHLQESSYGSLNTGTSKCTTPRDKAPALASWSLSFKLESSEPSKPTVSKPSEKKSFAQQSKCFFHRQHSKQAAQVSQGRVTRAQQASRTSIQKRCRSFFLFNKQHKATHNLHTRAPPFGTSVPNAKHLPLFLPSFLTSL